MNVQRNGRDPRSLWTGLFAVGLCACCGALAAEVKPDGSADDIPPHSRPVLKVDVGNPTQDKPQSKLWFAHGRWWAWLPVRGGSSVWQRTEQGWQRNTALDDALRGLPGQADVWADDDGVRAVLVARRKLAVVALRFDEAASNYVVAQDPVELAIPDDAQSKKGIETATIARDGRGRWWIAYDWDLKMWARASLAADGRQWTEPIALSEPAAGDDLCAVAALPGGVGLIWSDQRADAVFFRFHADEAPPGEWGPIETVEQGNLTADDHINTALAADGTLFVATKNEVDRVGRPQFVLRVRRPGGAWENHPYADRTKRWHPSRPIALLGGEPARLFLLHTYYPMQRGSGQQSVIAWQSTPLEPLDIAGDAPVLLSAAARLNNVTGCKSALPPGQPWIVLASDTSGGVYEARLDRP